MTQFAGVRVLIVEDEGFVAMMIEDVLEALGCEIVSSVASVDQAREIASHVDIDCAVLDINVAGVLVFPVAEVLRERQIPFLFSTGYGAGGLPAEFSESQILCKPFAESELEQKLARTLEAAQ